MVAARELDVRPPAIAADVSPEDGFARILSRIEEVSDATSGCFAFDHDDGKVVGAIFVERGRVCWAAATGLGRRLSDLLIARSHGALSRPHVETLVAECRANGRPLGERLVEQGLVTEPVLKQVLLEHTTESLEALAASGARERWVERRGGYRPQFTFGTGELLVCVERARAPFDARALDEHWTQVLGGEDAAVAFREAQGTLVPVAVRGALFTTSIRAVLAARGLAVSLSDAIARFRQAGAIVTGLTDTGSTYFSWCHGHLSSVAVAERSAPRTLGRILSARRLER